MIKNFLLFCFLIFSFLLNIKAQIGEGLFFDTSSNYPKPNEVFNIRLISYRYDLDRANIFWYLNGKLIDSGIGKKNINLKDLDKIGAFVIKAQIRTISGETDSIQKTFEPKLVKLFYEGLKSYTPYWYEGRPEVTLGGEFRVWAFVEMYNFGKKLQPNEILYKWYINDNYISEYSGVGKNFINYKSIEEYGNNIEIKLLVSAVENEENYLEETLNINTKDPKVLLILGDENGKYLNTYSNIKQKINKEKFSVIAEPLYFSTDFTKTNNLEYYWSNSVFDNTAIKFFQSPGVNKRAKIELEIKHIKKLFQQAKSYIEVEF